MNNQSDNKLELFRFRVPVHLNRPFPRTSTRGSSGTSSLWCSRWGKFLGSRNPSYNPKAGEIVAACRHYLIRAASLCSANTDSEFVKNISILCCATTQLPKAWECTLQKSGVVKTVVRGPAPLDVVVAESVCVVVMAICGPSRSRQRCCLNRRFRTSG